MLVPLITYILTRALLHEVKLPVVPVSDVVPAIVMLYVDVEPPDGQPERIQLPASIEKPPGIERMKTAFAPEAVPFAVIDISSLTVNTTPLE
jgi:hypothetical protein